MLLLQFISIGTVAAAHVHGAANVTDTPTFAPTKSAGHPIKACGDCSCLCSGLLCGAMDTLCDKAARGGATIGGPCSVAQGALNKAAFGLAKLEGPSSCFLCWGPQPQNSRLHTTYIWW